MRVRRYLAAGCAAALLAVGAVAVAPVAQAGLPTSVDPNIPDGDPDSLRDVLQGQVVDGDTVVLEAGATYTLDECDFGDIDIEAAVTIQGNGATIEQTCEDRVLDVFDAVTITDTTITGGYADESSGGGIYVDDELGSLVLQGSTVTGNEAGNGGGIFANGPVTIIESTLSDNAAADDGGAITNRTDLWVIRSTVEGNCSEDDGGAIDGDGDAWLVNSTVSGNVSDDQGAIAQDQGELTLVYSTIAANTLEDDVECTEVSIDALTADDDGPEVADIEEPSNLGLGEASLRSFGTVISNPIDVNEGSPGAYNCDLLGEGAAVTSSGYNYSDDDTCGFTDTTDVENGADPQLGVLASNGGPTQTHLPAAASPLVNAIPTAACGGGDALAEEAITTDQRNLVRPDVVNQQCDIGSVELQTEAPVALEPTFTG